jgi:ribosomal protein S18 acetylase RimI-like enzyme
MSGSSDPDLLGRLVEYDLTLERASSEIVEEFDWGLLIHNPETPNIWSGNYLQIRSTDLDAGALAELADEIQGPLEGIKHRDIVPANPDYGERLVQGFESLEGWDVVRSVYMVLSREPDREVGSAREVERAAVASVRRAVADDDPDFTREAVEQRLIRDARLDSVGNGRWFAAPADGEPGSACVLYDHEGVGQIETVVTLPEARNRGLATAVVMAAVDASRHAGHELTFIVADAEDWPWKLYERLGFDRVGELCSFVRKPPQLRDADSP